MQRCLFHIILMDALSAAFPSADVDSLLVSHSVFSVGGEVGGEDTFESLSYKKQQLRLIRFTVKSFILE